MASTTASAQGHGVKADHGKFLVSNQPTTDTNSSHNDAVARLDDDSAGPGSEVGIAVVTDRPAPLLQLLPVSGRYPCP